MAIYDDLVLRESMKTTYLIQRLTKPREEIFNLFAFGGGLANGGMSKQAMTLLNTIFSFDYMGSAEFEFGAVPQAFTFLAKQANEGNLIAGRLIWKRKNSKEYVYYICPKSYEEDVRARITVLRQAKNVHLKEFCGLKEYFDKTDTWYKQIQGWLELDNGFMFFVDEDMFQKTKKLFGIGSTTEEKVCR